jgi:hypothetical protein
MIKLLKAILATFGTLNQFAEDVGQAVLDYFFGVSKLEKELESADPNYWGELRPDADFADLGRAMKYQMNPHAYYSSLVEFGTGALREVKATGDFMVMESEGIERIDLPRSCPGCAAPLDLPKLSTQRWPRCDYCGGYVCGS